MDIIETVPLVNFKGDWVGNISIELTPQIRQGIATAGYNASESCLYHHLGQKLDLLINIYHASDLPRTLCSSVILLSLDCPQP
mmetsp:Transcript_31518/g.106859  ORF Transcript_31518/g.106859 Transcript_31518/m.106859 type:complete len:83 (+) Transcript_31518:2787-3035(+)